MPNFHLPFLKQKKEDSHKATSREYFLALEISHGVVKSAVWSVINDKTQVLSVGASSDWDDATPDSLVTASDASLTDCLSAPWVTSLPPKPWLDFWPIPRAFLPRPSAWASGPILSK